MNTALIPFGTRSTDLLQDFRRDVDQLMSRFLDADFDKGRQAWAPSTNLRETDTSYELTVDLPGMTPEDVDIEVKQGELWISGERKSEERQEGQTWHHIESRYGRFQRVFRFEEDVDADKVEATFSDGVLHISAPKAESAMRKHITIKQ